VADRGACPVVAAEHSSAQPISSRLDLLAEEVLAPFD